MMEAIRKEKKQNKNKQTKQTDKRRNWFLDACYMRKNRKKMRKKAKRSNFSVDITSSHGFLRSIVYFFDSINSDVLPFIIVIFL